MREQILLKGTEIGLQGMTPIAKIEIAIPIPIFIRNWDRDRDPDSNLKNAMRSDRDRSFGDRAIFFRSFKSFNATNSIAKLDDKTPKEYILVLFWIFVNKFKVKTELPLNVEYIVKLIEVSYWIF